MKHTFSKIGLSLVASSIVFASAALSAEESEGTHNTADVVVFYEPSFMEYWGEQEGYARIHRWVEYAGEALTNSGINGSYNIAKISPTFNIPDDLPYDSEVDENGTLITRGAGSLFSIYTLNAFDGHTENEIFTKFGGDFVIYVRGYDDEVSSDGSQVKGYAGIGGQFATIFDWQVKYPDVEDGALSTTTHEVGHLLGGGHERENNSFPSHQETYAAAYQCDGKNTAIYSTGNNSHHNFYSSPEMTLNGEDCGVLIGESDEADNRTVIKNSFPLFSQRANAIVSLGDVSFTSQIITVDELTGSVNVQLTRTGNLAEEASVEVASKDGTAVQGDDFTLGFIEAVFDAGEATTSVQFPIVTDSNIENNESFSLALRYPYKLSVKGGDSVVIITSNESNTTGDFTFGDVFASEQTGQACIDIDRTNGSTGEVIFSVGLSNGTADELDYSLDDDFIVFADGETSKEFCIDIVDDAIIEGDEVFTINLSTPLNVNYEQSTTITIQDNDGEDFTQGTIGFIFDTVSTSETSGSLVVTLTRTGGSDGEVTIALNTELVTASNNDFSLTENEITFLDGEIEKEVTINLVNDTIVENNESFNLSLSPVLPLNASVDDSSLIVTIESEDLQVVEEVVSDTSSGSGGGSFGYLLGLFLLIFRLKAR